jgi:hypothetical protein
MPSRESFEREELEKCVAPVIHTFRDYPTRLDKPDLLLYTLINRHQQKRQARDSRYDLYTRWVL